MTASAVRDQLAGALTAAGYVATPVGDTALRYAWEQAMAPRSFWEALPEGTFAIELAEGGLDVGFRIPMQALEWPTAIMTTILVVALLAMQQWWLAGLAVAAAIAMRLVNRALWRRNVVAFLRRTFPPGDAGRADVAPAA